MFNTDTPLIPKRRSGVGEGSGNLLSIENKGSHGSLGKMRELCRDFQKRALVVASDAK